MRDRAAAGGGCTVAAAGQPPSLLVERGSADDSLARRPGCPLAPNAETLDLTGVSAGLRQTDRLSGRPWNVCTLFVVAVASSDGVGTR